jgi:glycosyltransferase involved in cell wall biosynthesis
MNTPLVSVYIPTHNRKEFLRRAIESVLEQSYPSIEILVVDDASDDGTEAMMRAWCPQEPRLRYFRVETPSGANVARNIAIHASHGHFITGLDDDDFMLPHRVEKLVSAYTEDLAFVSSLYYLDDGRRRRPKRLTYKKTITVYDLLYSNIIGNQVLTTKEKMLNAGLFDENLLAAQDIDMWIRLLQNDGKAKIVQEYLQVVHINGHPSITGSQNKIRGYKQFYLKYCTRMSLNQRKYRMIGFMIMRRKRVGKIIRLLPSHPKYMLFSLWKIINYSIDMIR